MAHGCFYRAANASALKYLPQVGFDAHATILASNSRTVITQTFVNPSSTEAISEVFYSFPLYESSSIVGFTCRLGDTVIEGIVKPKEKAKEIYQEAKSKGQTAAMLNRSSSAADVFSTHLGNVPAGVPFSSRLLSSKNWPRMPRQMAFDIRSPSLLDPDMELELGFRICPKESS